MITVFDLRAKQSGEIMAEIETLYEQPMKAVNLGDQSINPCIGCWSCWVKTPGRCVMKDQMSEAYSDYVNSDKVILLMDTAQGFINHQGKAFLDRTIPHYHPYIEIVDGECHHVARYKRYPDLIFYYDTEGLAYQEEQVIEDYLYRTAYQFKSKAFRMLKAETLQIRSLEPRKAKNRAVDFSSIEAIDHLIIYNGSPRKSGSNSELILKKAKEVLKEKIEIRDLKDTDKWESWAQSFNSDEHVMFFMHLYVHSMPSHVKAFIEKLQASRGSISFFIQSGFPESSQSHYLEAYFEQLALRLERTYIGTAIKGGVEGLQVRPAKSQEQMMGVIIKTLQDLMDDGGFKQENISKLARPVRLGRGTLILFKLLSKTGHINFYWNHQLKKNDAYLSRFDCPF